jgi:hypothetical protein
VAQLPVRAVPYTASYRERWDAFVPGSSTGTILHTRRFLAYHGEKFLDRSLVFVDEAGAICGLLPAAQGPNEPDLVVSHPGATYGGLLLRGSEPGLLAFECLSLARAIYADLGYRRLEYRSVPAHLHGGWCQTDVYALWRMGARLRRRDLWNVIDLRPPGALKNSQRRRLARPPAGGIEVEREASEDAYAEFHSMLGSALAAHHSTRPVHSVQDMLLLQALFPREIALWLARDARGTCLAGVWAFQLGDVRHGQYGAASRLGQRHTAQDVVLRALIADSIARGDKYFSFGTSTESQGTHLNEGLFIYKAKFGTGSVVHDFYELDLASTAAC